MGGQWGYVVQFYRKEPGDSGINDIQVIADQDYEAVARKALLGYFTNPNIAAIQRPNHAQVLTYEGQNVLLTLAASPNNTVERV